MAHISSSEPLKCKSVSKDEDETFKDKSYSLIVVSKCYKDWKTGFVNMTHLSGIDQQPTGQIY